MKVEAPRRAVTLDEVRAHRDAITRLGECFGVRNIRVFGSVAPWRQIIATRNRVVHGYFEVDRDILWDVAVIDVPELASQVLLIQSGQGTDLPEE